MRFDSPDRRGRTTRETRPYPGPGGSFRLSRSRPSSLDRGGTLLTSRANYQQNAAKKIEPWISSNARHDSAFYDENSDSSNWTAEQRAKRPPRPLRKSSYSRNSHVFTSEDEQMMEDQQRRFHTIERSDKISRAKPKRESFSRDQRSCSPRERNSNSSYDNGLLKRTKSFSSTGGRTVKNDYKHFSVYGSIKSLYKSLAKAAGMKVKADKKPQAPPRKSRRQDHEQENSDTNRRWTSYSGQTRGQETSFKERRGQGLHMTSYTNQGVRRRSDSRDDHDRHERQQERGRRVERRKTFNSFDLTDNRDPPMFEPRKRQRSSGRYFGSGYDDEVIGFDRPAPDMRRHLLGNVNLSRRNSMSSGGKASSSDGKFKIRAI